MGKSISLKHDYAFKPLSLKASTKNPGILEAIKEVRIMSLRKNLRLLHEARQKEIRDRAAREDYVRSEGLREGRSEGRREGEDRLNSLNCRLIEDKRFEDLERATRDKEYRERLYNEYEIYEYSNCNSTVRQ